MQSHAASAAPQPSPRKTLRFRHFFVRAMLGPRHSSSDECYASMTNDPDVRIDPKGLYTNMGWWGDGAGDVTSACEALLARVARWARIDEAETLLDVGFGTGGPLVFWGRASGARIWGVNRSQDQTAVATTLVRNDVAGDRIFPTRGDASALAFPAESFDAVLAVEAAFHFATRESFFQEAWRVLRPGGRLVMTDIVPSSEYRGLARLCWWIFDRFVHAPAANRVTAEALRIQLEELGFKVELDVRTQETITGFFRWGSHGFGEPLARIACGVIARLFAARPPVECVFVRATKPRTVPSRGV